MIDIVVVDNRVDGRKRGGIDRHDEWSALRGLAGDIASAGDFIIIDGVVIADIVDPNLIALVFAA